MAWYTYDCEVSSHDWLVIFKERTSGEYTIVHNNPDALTAFISQGKDDIFCGFNSKHYDQFIIKAICIGLTVEQIKALSDWLIRDGNGWQYPLLQDVTFRFNNIDIRDDCQMGLSLKAIEGHLGLSVEESTVDFALERPWTEDELREMIYYCQHDVDTTERLTEIRREYLRTKMNIGAMVGIEPIRAMAMTNAKLTAAFLQAKPPETPWTDERQYKIPDNLKREYIPQEVFNFFARMYDESLSDDEVFKSSMELQIGECPITIAYGGIHAAIPNYIWRQEEHQTIIRNFDVGSFYPHLLTINGYISRNIPSPDVYENMLERRMKAKKAGDKVLANALKLVANTTYGAQLNKFNPLYDPLMARSVCISGQLYLLELAEHLYKDIQGLKLVALNTDGIMVEFDPMQYDSVMDILEEWQQRTGFTLEEDKIKTLVQANVNNYLEIAEDGSVKTKGGYLVRGIAPAGAFNINNNAVIVATAIREYFVHQTPVEQTITECSDISQFQLIAKAGTKYREAYLMVDGERHPVQRVNRVYATTDARYGKLYKVKMTDDSESKIGSLPEHCLIDNRAVDDPHHTSIDQIDKGWYIQQALDGIDRFLGVEKERKKAMPRTATPKPEETTPTTANVYTKLLTARKFFLEEAIKKSGKANKLGYKYFELDDIVPVAIQIFYDLHLLPQVCFSADLATMTIINTDDPSDMITFTSPMANDTGGLISNEIQKLGSVQTYLRRYLYMMALDIVEADQIEASTGITPKATAPAQPKVAAPVTQKAAGPAVEQPKPHAPVTQEQREAIKEELTDADGPADELMLNGLKEAVKKYRLAGGGKHDAECVQYAMETKGFTTATKTRCAEIIKAINTAMTEAK